MAWAAPMSEDVAPPVTALLLIYVYIALAVGSSICVLVRALLLITARYRTATFLFNKIHISIFRAPMLFFDSTPTGRILNRGTIDLGSDRPRPRSSVSSRREKIVLSREDLGVAISAQTFNYPELATATNNFRAESFIGEGDFRKVYKGRLDRMGQIVAVK